MQIFVRALLAILVAAVFSGSVMGCNTFKGMGKDIEEGGEAIQDTSDEVKN